MKLITDRRLRAAARALRQWRSSTAATFLGLTAAARRRPPGLGRRWIGRGACRRHRGALRRLGRRRAGGDRQIRLPALHREDRPQGRAGNVRRRERDHHQDQDLQARATSRSSIPRASNITIRYVDGGWQLGDQRSQHSQYGQVCMPAMIEPFRKITPKLSGRALRLRHHRHRLQHNGDLAGGSQGEGRQPAHRPEVRRQDRRLSPT